MHHALRATEALMAAVCCLFSAPSAYGATESPLPRPQVMAALAACVDNPSLADLASVGRIFSEQGNETIGTIIEVVFPESLARLDKTSMSESLRELGAPNYRDREAASERLVMLGRRVLPYVKPLLNSDDPELRFRATYICAVLDRPVRPLFRDRNRTLGAIYSLLWQTMPLDTMCAGVKANWASLARVDTVGENREMDILGVLLASMRYSPDEDDHRALIAFARTASDGPASVAIRVIHGGLLHALDQHSADRWLPLPALMPFDAAEFMDPHRPECYRAALACSASATVLARSRKDARTGALAKDKSLLHDVNATLLQEYGDGAARQFFLSRLRFPNEAEDALIQLFARDGSAAASATETAGVSRDPRLAALWDHLFEPEARPAAGQTPACLYIWIGPAPVDHPWCSHLTLTPQDHQLTSGKEMAPLVRTTSWFRVERLDDIPSGRYEVRLDDGATCVRRGVFLTHGINVVLIPPLRIVGDNAHYSLPPQDSTRLMWRYDLGDVPNDLCASVRCEEREGRFSFSGYRALNGQFSFTRIPEAFYKVNVQVESPQFRFTTEPSQLHLTLPPLSSGVLRFPFRRVAGLLDPIPTNSVPVSVTFRTRVRAGDDGVARAVWNADSDHWRQADLSVTATVANDGSFTAPLFPQDWLAVCDTKGIVMEQPVTVGTDVDNVTLHAHHRRQFRLQVKVSDVADGKPLDTGQVFAVVPVSHVSAIGGFVNEQGIRNGIATFEPRDACSGFSLYVRAPGYMNSLPEFFDLDRDTVIEIDLQKGGAVLTGRIVNALTEESVADVPTIGLYYRAAQESMLLDYYHFDPKERCFRVPGLRPGQYFVRLWGYETLSGANFHVAEGETACEIELRVRPPK